MNKQQKGIFISGTDTDVGKTYIGAQIVRALHNKDINVIPRKLIESGCKRIGNNLIPDDATHYFEAIEKKIPLEEICPFRYEPAISPQRAARLVKQTILIQNLIESCYVNVTNNDILAVEGAGGFYSPLCEDGLNADLAKELQLPVILIANDKLGCINHILLTIEAIQQKELKLLCVVLNKKDDEDNNAMNNFEDLKTLVDVPIFSVSRNEQISQESTVVEYICNYHRLI